MRAIRLLSTLVLATIPVGCDSAGKCEPGTVQMGATCYAHDPADDVPPVITIDPPVHTRSVGNVRLTSNEHATIYYTTDGTTPNKLSLNEEDVVLLPNVPDDAVVGFFAVDVNGNASPVQMMHWNVDTIGPGAPVPFDVAIAGDMRTVTWTPPADLQLGGVLVVRVEGVQTGGPEDGRHYFPGNELAPGMTVVAVVAPGFAGKFSETRSAAPGLVRYVAYSFDDVYNYGPPAGDHAVTTVPAQTATASVDSATGIVTVSAQPANLMLAGKAVLVGSNLTVTLDVTNATTRTLFAPKLLLTNTLATASFNNNDGTFMTFPYRALGGAIPPGVKFTTTLEFGNVTSGDVVPLSLDVRDNPVLVSTHWDNISGSAIDEATERTVVDLQAGKLGPMGENAMRAGGVTVDGRLVTGSRVNPEIASFDLGTGKRILSNVLAKGKASVQFTILDPSGSAGYALLLYSHPYTLRADEGGHGSVPSELVTFDAATLRVTGRLPIGVSRNRDLSLSSDGKWLAIATGFESTGVVIVELATLRIARNLTPTQAVSTAVFTTDSSSLLTAGVTSLDVYAVKDGTRTASIPLPPGSGGKTYRGEFGPDGRFWVSRENDVVAVNLDTKVATSYPYSGGIIHVYGSKIYVADEGDSSPTIIDATGTEDTTVSLSFSDSMYGHWMGHSPF